MNRSTWLKSAAALGVSAAFLPSRAAAQFIVHDPINFQALVAHYAVLLKQLANDYIHNKNELMMINLLFHEWNAMQYEHHLDIGTIWNEAQPYINQFEQALVKNDRISQATGDIYTAIQDTFPDFNPSKPVPYLIQLYREYMKVSMRNSIAAGQMAQKQAQTYAQNTGQLVTQAQAAASGSEANKYTVAQQMSAHIADGINMLQAAVSRQVQDFGAYVSYQVAQAQSTENIGKAIFAKQLLTTTGTQIQQGLKHTADDYVNNPSLLPVMPTPVP